MTARIDGELSARRQQPPQPSAGFASLRIGYMGVRERKSLHHTERPEKLRDIRQCVKWIHIERFVRMRETLKPKNIRLCLCELFFSSAVRCGSAKRWYEMRRDIEATHFCSFFLVILQLLCVRRFSLEPKANVCMQG